MECVIAAAWFIVLWELTCFKVRNDPCQQSLPQVVIVLFLSLYVIVDCTPRSDKTCKLVHLSLIRSIRKLDSIIVSNMNAFDNCAHIKASHYRHCFTKCNVPSPETRLSKLHNHLFDHFRLIDRLIRLICELQMFLLSEYRHAGPHFKVCNL